MGRRKLGHRPSEATVTKIEPPEQPPSIGRPRAPKKKKRGRPGKGGSIKKEKSVKREKRKRKRKKRESDSEYDDEDDDGYHYSQTQYAPDSYVGIRTDDGEVRIQIPRGNDGAGQCAKVKFSVF